LSREWRGQEAPAVRGPGNGADVPLPSAWSHPDVGCRRERVSRVRGVGESQRDIRWVEGRV
jgi:hypothetical protein